MRVENDAVPLIYLQRTFLFGAWSILPSGFEKDILNSVGEALIDGQTRNCPAFSVTP